MGKYAITIYYVRYKNTLLIINDESCHMRFRILLWYISIDIDAPHIVEWFECWIENDSQIMYFTVFLI